MPSPLLTAATSTFEALALLLAEPAAAAVGAAMGEPADASAGQALADGHAVRVAFRGPFDGALHVAVSAPLAAALAANMLGIPLAHARADAALRQDALGELANVICGNVLPLVGGRAAVFHLAAPAALDLPAALQGAALAPCAEWLDVEGAPAVVALHVPDAVGAPLAARLSPPSSPLPSPAPVALVP